jgi:hypothetical protein
MKLVNLISHRILSRNTVKPYFCVDIIINVQSLNFYANCYSLYKSRALSLHDPYGKSQSTPLSGNNYLFYNLLNGCTIRDV